MAITYDDRSANLKLPLPNRANDMADDCGRIAQSLNMIDAECKTLREEFSASKETAQEKVGSQTITVDSPGCINLKTSGVVTLSFVAADPDVRAVKALSITALTDTALNVEGAVWQFNGNPPGWGNAGKILVLIAHFVGGRVVLSVADNTEA